jgi:hypothetical protein
MEPKKKPAKQQPAAGNTKPDTSQRARQLAMGQSKD